MTHRTRLAAAIASAILLPHPLANAQTAATAPEAATQLETIVVTGSRIKRSEIERASPVVVITREQMDAQGFNTVYDALSAITQANGSFQSEAFVSGFTPNANVINLRGLGANRTLLLIDGRRVADYPLPFNGRANVSNYANIPAAMVERIEVLAGGASAIYGSDAVAGVVNVILRKFLNTHEIAVRAGSSTQGGRDTGRLQATGGIDGGHWNLTYGLEAYSTEAVFANQRARVDSLLDNPSPAGVTGQQPDLMLTLTNPLTGGLFRLPGDIDATCAAFGGEWLPWDYRDSSGAVFSRQCGSFTSRAQQTVTNGRDNVSGYLRGTHNFTETLEGWAHVQATVADATNSRGNLFWSGPSVNGAWFDSRFNRPLAGSRVFTVAEAGGLDALLSRFDEQSIDASMGLKGWMANGFEWESGLSWSEYDATQSTPRMMTDAVNRFFLGAQTGTHSSGLPIHTLNIERYLRPLTREEYGSLITRAETRGESSVLTGYSVLSGTLATLPAGPLSFASILEVASQEYTLTPDARALPGVNGIYNLVGTGGGERDRYALGVEFSVPLAESLLATAATRFDKYDDVTDVDNALTWNAGLEWRPLDSLLVRGTYATTFRAPDMHFVFADASQGFQQVFDSWRCASETPATGCGNSRYQYTAQVSRAGSAMLEEETGRSFTVGAVWDITDALTLSADYYDIEIEGAVADLSTSTLLFQEAECRIAGTASAACADVLSRITRLSGTGTTRDGQILDIRTMPINQAYRRVRGIDATVGYTLETATAGTFALEAGWSHTLKNEAAEFISDPIRNVRDLPGVQDYRSRTRAAIRWERDNWNATLLGYSSGSRPNFAGTGRLSSYTLWNGSVSYDLTENATVGLSANNLFDRDPPLDVTHTAYPFRADGFDTVGREFAVDFVWRF